MKFDIFFTAALTSLLFSSAAHASGGGHGGGGKPLCTGQEPPRKGAPFTENASYGLKVDAYQAAIASYELAHPEAAEYASVSRSLVGVSCVVDADCTTGDSSRFVGSCLRYLWDGTNGSCQVLAAIPIPAAPATPLFNCDDVACPSSFQCEVEDSTGAVGCVEQRTCRQP